MLLLLAQEPAYAPAAEAIRDIVDTPVSPELLPGADGEIGQITEEVVGPYELHDFFLYHCLKYGSGPRKILRLAERAFHGRYEKDTILRWMELFYKRFFAAQFKRSCLPDGPGAVSYTHLTCPLCWTPPAVCLPGPAKPISPGMWNLRKPSAWPII